MEYQLSQQLNSVFQRYFL